MRPTVLLFDIDGTLITTGGAGKRAVERAFAELYGRPDACSGFSFGGMTDRAIVRRALTLLGAEASESAIDELIARYVRVLAEEVTRVEAARYRVHEGVRAAIAAGKARNFAVGLGTGNVVEGARIKLGRVGIYEEFAFGGFGSDAEDRGLLIRIGAERGAAQLGVPRAECRVVVIGDTPKDIDAARAAGAESLAVATGSFALGALVEAGASHAFQSLASRGALEAMLDGG